MSKLTVTTLHGLHNWLAFVTIMTGDVIAAQHPTYSDAIHRTVSDSIDGPKLHDFIEEWKHTPYKSIRAKWEVQFERELEIAIKKVKEGFHGYQINQQ